jgi:alpha-tubulin suppressor-like RCC1 family protein
LFRFVVGEFGTGEIGRYNNTVLRNDNSTIVGGYVGGLINNLGEAFMYPNLVKLNTTVKFKAILDDIYANGYSSRLVTDDGKLVSTYTIGGQVYFQTYNRYPEIIQVGTSHVLTPDGIYGDGVLVFPNSYFGNETVQKLSASSSISMHYGALLSNGSLLMWGKNENYQLGDGTQQTLTINTTIAQVPVPIKDVKTGNQFTVALTTTGQVYYWGKVSDLVPIQRLPVLVRAPGKVFSSVLAGSDYVILISEGLAYAFGANDQGQLLDGTTISRIEPVFCVLLRGDPILFASVSYNNAAVFVTQNAFKITNINAPEKEYKWEEMVTTETGRIKSVVGGMHFNILIAESNKVYGVGHNGFGSLGDGTRTNAMLPVALNMNDNLYQKKVTNVYATGSTATVYAIANGEVFWWGMGGFGYGSRVAVLPQKSEVLLNTAVKELMFVNSFYLVRGSDDKIYVNNATLQLPVPEIAGSTMTLLNTVSDGGIFVTDKERIVFVAISYYQAQEHLKGKYYSTPFTFLYDNLAYITIYTLNGTLDVEGLSRIDYWRVDDKDTILATMKNGSTYYSLDGYWIPYYTDINVTLSKQDILVFNNRTIIMQNFIQYASYDEGSTSYGPKFTEYISNIPPDFKKIISVTKNPKSITAVFGNCSSSFTGDECETPLCYGIPSDHPSVCNGHGKCTAPQTCECDLDWGNSTCNECKTENCRTCFDVQATSKSVCSGHGKCVAKDLCECDAFRVSVNCASLSELSQALIALGVIAALFIASILVTGICIFTCRYRLRLVRQEKAEKDIKDLLHQSLIRADALADQVDRDWVIPFVDLKFNDKISEGSFGVVFKGSYKGGDVYVLFHHINYIVLSK